MVLASGSSVLWLLLVLACPLMMFFMMRGHGHGGHAAAGGCHGGHEDAKDAAPEQPSIDELRRRVDELNAQIDALEKQGRERVGSTG